MLRLCLLDVGKKYVKRIVFYSSTFLAIYAIYAVIFLVDFFGILTLNLTTVMNSIALFDIFYVLGVLIVMFLLGAYINKEYVEHRTIIMSLKSNVIFIKNNLFDFLKSTKKFTSGYLRVYQRLLRAYF